jgi:hypothetical protein
LTEALPDSSGTDRVFLLHDQHNSCTIPIELLPACLLTWASENTLDAGAMAEDSDLYLLVSFTVHVGCSSQSDRQLAQEQED